jgi:two-component system, NarL family, response regulator
MNGVLTCVATAVTMKKAGPLKLLIVDDSASTRRLIKTLVTTLGPDPACEVYECSDGSETMDAYRLRQPDFVLMDIQMKTMDGITATVQIKAADPNARIVMVTNYDQADLREAALQAGAYAFVGKDDLFKLVHLLERENC